ncbi:MAG: hypothetical protein IK104_01090 [Clostridia bacterium]|nr:hypothetical protein [Clostridia bacterium]
MVNAPILTDAGRALLMRAIAGDGLVFTKFEIGSGAPPADAADLEELVIPEYEFGITAIDKTTSGYVTITGSFDNSIIEEPMRWTELGLFAKLDEQGADEVLYAYVNDGDDAGMLTPAGAVVAEQTVNLMIVVGDAENVTAIMAESAVFATKAELQEHEADKSNPHNVTKAQVGLGNVENLPFDNQVVNFSAAGTLEEPLTGERMTTLMGKIKKAVSSLISHIGNNSNPHSVTRAQLGAAAASHTHNASDINAGVLSVTRGGTGVSALSTAPTAGDTAPITSDGVYGPIHDLSESLWEIVSYVAGPPLVVLSSDYADQIIVIFGFGVCTVAVRNLKNMPAGVETEIGTLPTTYDFGIAYGGVRTVRLAPPYNIAQDVCCPSDNALRVRLHVKTNGKIYAQTYHTTGTSGSLNLYAAVTYVCGI